MKHLIKKWNGWNAGCKRPGCMAGLVGGIVEDMTKKQLNDFFTNNCPKIFNSKKMNMTHDESVAYLLKRADKEIKDWQKIIDYWLNVKE